MKLCCFLPDVSLLNDTAAQYPSCDVGSVGSVVLKNTTINTATVAYYTWFQCLFLYVMRAVCMN